MGFLPNIFKFGSDTIPNIITLGGYSVAKESIRAGVNIGVPALQGLLRVAGPALAPLTGSRSQQGVQQYVNQPQPYQNYQPQYTAPTPYYDYGGAFGGSPWDSSIQSSPSFPQATYSPGSSGPKYPEEFLSSIPWGEGW